MKAQYLYEVAGMITIKYIGSTCVLVANLKPLTWTLRAGFTP